MRRMFALRVSSFLFLFLSSRVDAQSASAAGPFCTLCMDGTNPPLLDAPVFDFENTNNTTCADLAIAASQILVQNEATFLACRQLQDVGLSNCGCTTPDTLKTGCTLCPSSSSEEEGGDSVVPNPEKEIIPLVTCGGIARVVERFEESECRAYQTIIGAFCECPVVTESEGKNDKNDDDDICRICGNDAFVDFPAAAVDLSEIGLNQVPCAFYETIVNDPAFTQGIPCAVFQTDAPTCCMSWSSFDLPPAPANLAELCAPVQVETEFQACAAACLLAECCDPEQQQQQQPSCVNNTQCPGYAPCQGLQVVDGTIVVVDDSIPTMNDDNDTTTSDANKSGVTETLVHTLFWSFFTFVGWRAGERTPLMLHSGTH